VSEPTTAAHAQVVPSGAAPPRSFLKKALSILWLVLVNFLVFAVAAELASIVIVHLRRWPSARPAYHLTFNTFWTDTDPVFGIWHPPNGHFLHQEGCFSVEYTTNSYGARDVERSPHSDRPRTVVLGDSIIEGFGARDEDRLTNILEQRTGREHLNFGNGGGFSALQYSLLYRSLAAKFDHNRVLVGVLPDNDFHEMDKTWLEWAYPGQYRPYYKDDLTVGYLGTYHSQDKEDLWERVKAVMRAYLASYHVGQYLAVTRFAKRRTYSGYNDYSDVDFQRLQTALLDIKKTADKHGAKVYVFLVPRANDFEHARQGINRLGPALTSWGAEHGIPVKDLLPEMAAATHGDYGPIFLRCDDHWSPYGARLAADIVQPWMYGK